MYVHECMYLTILYLGMYVNMYIPTYYCMYVCIIISMYVVSTFIVPDLLSLHTMM